MKQNQKNNYFELFKTGLKHLINHEFDIAFDFLYHAYDEYAEKGGRDEYPCIALEFLEYYMDLSGLSGTIKPYSALSDLICGLTNAYNIVLNELKDVIKPINEQYDFENLEDLEMTFYQINYLATYFYIDHLSDDKKISKININEDMAKFINDYFILGKPEAIQESSFSKINDEFLRKLLIIDNIYEDNLDSKDSVMWLFEYFNEFLDLTLNKILNFSKQLKMPDKLFNEMEKEIKEISSIYTKEYKIAIKEIK